MKSGHRKYGNKAKTAFHNGPEGGAERRRAVVVMDCDCCAAVGPGPLAVISGTVNSALQLQYSVCPPISSWTEDEVQMDYERLREFGIWGCCGNVEVII